MVTSRLPNGWTASADVFSGRPNPEWPVPERVAEDLILRWRGLPLSDRRIPDRPLLGYRGCLLRAPDGREWHGYDRIVVATGESGTRHSRTDNDRAWQRYLLQTAPPGLLPAIKLTAD
jgi:hypothetical protein